MTEEEHASNVRLLAFLDNSPDWYYDEKWCAFRRIEAMKEPVKSEPGCGEHIRDLCTRLGLEDLSHDILFALTIPTLLDAILKRVEKLEAK